MYTVKQFEIVFSFNVKDTKYTFHVYIILDIPITYRNASVLCQSECACLQKTVNMVVFFTKTIANTYPKGRALMQMYRVVPEMKRRIWIKKQMELLCTEGLRIHIWLPLISDKCEWKVFCNIYIIYIYICFGFKYWIYIYIYQIVFSMKQFLYSWRAFLTFLSRPQKSSIAKITEIYLWNCIQYKCTLIQKVLFLFYVCLNFCVSDKKKEVWY